MESFLILNTLIPIPSKSHGRKKFTSYRERVVRRGRKKKKVVSFLRHKKESSAEEAMYF
jgi:hypothetical protein